MELLRTEGLRKEYGSKDSKVVALKPTNLIINKGEFTAIVGPSGSGKSTLLHLLAALDRPSSGHVYVNDKDIYTMNENDLSAFRRRNIGFIFQAFNLIPILSVEENIKLPLLMDGKKVDDGHIKEIMKALDIESRANHLPGEISGGQQQRTSIARALANKPEIIFADEPTGNLDSKNSNEVLDLLTSSIKRYNQTLVMITHDKDIAKRADRVITLFDGQIVEDKRIN
ncbi:MULTISPECIES: ATP-binding cassette domain-containing protein [unclassified Clostridium]|uniref:ATP-binding cassette domain-containing protein n=1 Tax=unclassified Clostridium TaxID=2614128 RepID=UPI0012432018